jgi:hypothetical protein
MTGISAETARQASRDANHRVPNATREDELAAVRADGVNRPSQRTIHPIDPERNRVRLAKLRRRESTSLSFMDGPAVTRRAADPQARLGGWRPNGVLSQDQDRLERQLHVVSSRT